MSSSADSSPSSAPGGWGRRRLDPQLTDRYRAEGYWTDESLGRVLDECLAAHPDLAFTFRSPDHPWMGTYRQMHDLARRVAGGLAQHGVGPGDVLAFQTPNWVEGAATFYAGAFLGAVVVPIVHIYGPKELAYILRQTGVRTLVLADRFGAIDYQANLRSVLDPATALRQVFVVGDLDHGRHSGPVIWDAFDQLAHADPIDAPVEVAADEPVLVGYTSGTTADPKGVIHTHNTALAETRQLIAMMPGVEARPPWWPLPSATPSACWPACSPRCWSAVPPTCSTTGIRPRCWP